MSNQELIAEAMASRSTRTHRAALTVVSFTVRFAIYENYSGKKMNFKCFLAATTSTVLSVLLSGSVCLMVPNLAYSAETDALRNRLGETPTSKDPQGILNEEVNGAEGFGAAVLALDGDVTPEFSERTSDHLNLVGASQTDSTWKRLSLGDFNNDGVEDVIVARKDNTLQLFINQGGVLVRQTDAFAVGSDANNVRHAGVLDANGDNWPDLILRDKLLMNLQQNVNGDWQGFAAGVTIAGAEANPFTIQTGDFDGDGDIDAVTTPERKMLVNNGAGALAHDGSRMGSNTLDGPIKFDALDIDGDGDLDLAGPHVNESQHFAYFNDGTGTFANSARMSLPLDTLSYVQVGADFNADGISDFRVYSDGNPPRAFMSTGGFTGQFPMYDRRIDPLVAGDQGKHGLSHIRDLDNDGDLDFVLSSIELFIDIAEPINERSNIVLNMGVNTGTFDSVSDSVWASEESYDIKMVDINVDGNLDLLIAHQNRLAVYINDAPPLVVEILGHTNSAVQVNSIATIDVESSAGAGAVYTWDFGDGSAATTSTSPTTSHTYSNPGRYQVTVTVNEGVVSDSYILFQTVFEGQTANTPNHSSTVAYQRMGGAVSADRVWVVNSDHDSVSAIRLGDGQRLAEIKVGSNPTSLAFAGDGRLYVTNKAANSISIIDADNFTVVDTFSGFARGTRPHGIVFDPQSNSMLAYVTLEATGQVARLDFSNDELILGSVGPHARELSINANGSLLYVSRFITAPVPGESTTNLGTGGGGDVWVLNSSDLSLQGTIKLPYNNQPDEATSSRGIPNYLMAPVISPSGSRAYVPASLSNIYRGQFRDGNSREHNMLVRSMLGTLNLQSNQEVIAQRHDFDNSAQPRAGAFDPTGNYLYLVFENSRKLRVFDVYSRQSLASIDLGFAPTGVTVSPDGTRVVAHNWLSRSVSVIDASQFASGNTNTVTLQGEYSTVSNEVLSAALLKGKRLFFDSADPRLSSQSYIACSTCHADGGHDGRTWDFSDVGEGLRNTTDLRGRSGMGHGNVHWTANFDEIQDFENDIRDIFKGNGLMNNADFDNAASTLGTPKSGKSSDLDALALFVASLSSQGASPYKTAAGAFTASAIAGQQVFQSRNCASCHSGATFTDSTQGGQFHDIGTVDAATGDRLGMPLVDGGLDTPTLIGLWNGAPYLHDGSAATVRDAVLAHTSAAVGANVSNLTDTELTNLTDLLVQIEDGDTIDVSDAAPTVSIQSPADGDVFSGSSAVSLTASADDGEDGDLTDTVVWESDLDGILGTGNGTTLLSVGNHVISATVTDSGNMSASATVNVVVEVAVLNIPPVAVDDSIGPIDTDSTVTFSVVENDTDEDGQIDASSVLIINPPESGTVEVAIDGQVTYTHDGLSIVESDSFTYTVLDNSGDVSNEATVTIAPIEKATEANLDLAMIEPELRDWFEEIKTKFHVRLVLNNFIENQDLENDEKFLNTIPDGRVVTITYYAAPGDSTSNENAFELQNPDDKLFSIKTFVPRSNRGIRASIPLNLFRDKLSGGTWLIYGCAHLDGEVNTDNNCSDTAEFGEESKF